MQKSRPFGTEEVAHWEAELRRKTGLVMTLGTALWGRTSEDLRRQLLALHPEIPPGFDLADFRELLRWTAQISSAVVAARRRGFSPSMLSSPTVMVGNEGFTVWEARYEIVRRAIDYLEEH
ncbi:MAG TPA: hypothetical protein VMG35_25840 [Bryobacteraceae bacterium]|nr:hypothetical protein [Bryobacteraceae bacterium]